MQSPWLPWLLGCVALALSFVAESRGVVLAHFILSMLAVVLLIAAAVLSLRRLVVG